MHAYRKQFAFLFALVLFLTALPGAQASDEWYWLSSDAKYSKFFSPESVEVTRRVETEAGYVATEIEAWTKTGFSYGGAEETIAAYGIKKQIPDPRALSYSFALVRINPQNRTLQYVRENFYDKNGHVLWSATEDSGKRKEINSQSFDEPFYAAVVDQVFQQGERDRMLAKDRWLPLWDGKTSAGHVHAMADTTTMRLKGNNLIYWEWDETKDDEGNVLEIHLLKKATNLDQGTERIVRGERWTPNAAWQTYVDDMDGAYQEIRKTSPAYAGISALRTFAKSARTWVNRYNLN